MIVSASRRTDLPALYAPWLRTRLAAGRAEVANPFRPTQVRAVDLRPPPAGTLEALVLWTRDPGPLLADVPAWETAGLRSLWLVTITGYPPVLEPAAPDSGAAVAAVRALSQRVGARRIAWRYDPVFLCSPLGLTREWHRQNFRALARSLGGAASRCILSFYDDYAKARARLRAAGALPDREADVLPLAGDLAGEALAAGLEVQTCCEELVPAVASGGCIDGALLDALWGLGLEGRTDPGQREGCRCVPSVDLGAYDTCVHGCRYCYATGSPVRVRNNLYSHDPTTARLL